MWILGLVLLGVSGFLFYSRQASLKKSMNLQYHETSKISEVHENFEHIKNELGEGNFNQIVELKGVAQTDQPLQAEHTQKSVVYYKAEVIREYEVTVEEKDSEGNITRNRERRSDTMSTNEQYAPFFLDDNSGKKIKIDMEGAEKHAQQSLDDFRSEAPTGMNVAVGGLKMAFGGGDSRTLGYRYVEQIIPLGANLYILGEATDRRGGELTVVKPVEKKENFIVSTKSEEQLLKSAQGSAQGYMIGGIVAVIVGVILLLGGLLGLF